MPKYINKDNLRYKMSRRGSGHFQVMTQREASGMSWYWSLDIKVWGKPCPCMAQGGTAEGQKEWDCGGEYKAGQDSCCENVCDQMRLDKLVTCKALISPTLLYLEVYKMP